MRKPTPLLALWLVAALFSPSFSAAAVEIVVPGNRWLTHSDTAVVIGRATRGQQLQWSIARSGTTEEATVTADWGHLFEIFLLLDPGLNRVRVEDATVDIFYDDGRGNVPPGFAPQRIHAGDVARCDDCHDPQHEKLLHGGYPDVCLSCHLVVSANPDNSAAAEDDRHFQTAVAACGRCHEAHTGTHRKLLRDDNAALCGECHQALANRADSHSGREEGQCVTCHDPHYSGYPAALLQSQPQLCHDCHEQGYEQGSDGKDRHPPVPPQDACTTCHDPHGEQPALLLATAAELCSRCHGAVLERGHGGELADCTPCHAAHGTLGNRLLPVAPDPQCLECHPDVVDGVTRHGALDDGCQTCHNPHADTDLEAARSGCQSCHDPATDRELHSLHGNLQLPAASCVRCHPPHAADHERLVRGNLHYPLTQGKCSACHGGGSDRSIVISDAASRCRMCHALEQQIQSRTAVTHAPVADGDCSACHDPHMSDQPAFLRSAEADLCRSCHDISQPNGGKALHPPAENCSECHRPHGGAVRYLLHTDADQLCLECHDDPRQGLEPLHPALDEGCSSCHDPHAGYLPGYQRGDRPGAACSECHDVPDLSAGRQLHSAAARCSNCHQPHGGSAAAYLKFAPGDNCVVCHRPPAEDDAAHAAMDDGCPACHDPHSGYSGAVLTTPERELCLECHDDPVGDRAHPHTPATTACSSCHQPHASAWSPLLRQPWLDLCTACHPFRATTAAATVHEPVADCGNCHDLSPHSTPHPRGLELSPPELCLECHDDPAAAAGADVHPALDEGCSVCHAAHVGLRPGLQAGSAPGDTCIACHDDPREGQKVVHPALDDGCSGCHDAHGSANNALLHTSGNTLCQTCHDSAAHRHTLDPTRGAKYPGAATFARHGAEFACVGCHDPHAAAEGALYAAPSGELCQRCHEL